MVKILQDNGRIIIIIENDDNINMQKFTEEITKTAMSLCIPTKEEEVIGLDAIEPTTEDIEEIISETTDITAEEQEKIILKQMMEQVGEEIKEEEKDISDDLYDANYLYPGEKPMDVILSQNSMKEQDKVCVKLYTSCKDIQSKNLKKLIVDDLKEYLKNRFNDLSEEKINSLSKEEISNTLIIYEPLVKNTVKYILSQAGYTSLESFLNTSDIINIVSAYYAIISNLMKQSWLQ